MNSADKNNPQLDAILRRTMREAPGDDTSNHPEADVIAAYHDRSVANPERARLEQHFSDCARCQTLLASIARAESENVAAPKPSNVVRLHRWRVAVPVLAAAAVILIALRFTRGTDNQLEREQIAMSERAAPANAPAPAMEPVAPMQAAPSGQEASAPASGALALNEKKSEPAVEARQDMLADRLKASEKDKSFGAIAGAPKSQLKALDTDLAKRAVEAKAEPGTAAKVETERVANAAPEIAANAPAEPPRAPVPASPPAALAMRADSAAAIASSSASASSNSVGGASGSSSAAAAASGGAGAPVKGPALGYSAPTVSHPGFNAAVSVDGSAWQVGANGKIEHSDGGGAFVAQNSGVTAELSAAAAVSRDVCWVGGNAGTILRTVDGGTNWHKLASPTSADISGIAASSADSASITTVDGESFATSDGGNSWHPQ
jgi:photosynthesis system II assembly factor YCF48-like protein